jgi:sulfur carrier protein ThiS
MAQRYAAQIIASRSTVTDKDTQYESVDIDSVALVRPRCIGIEHLALQAVKQLTLDDKLKALGFNQHHVAAALGNIIGRMAAPASELATHGWTRLAAGNQWLR